jgi:solute:Na+ symporter, SSS family
MGFATVDLLVFFGYLFIVIGLGLWVSRTKRGTEKKSDDYFFAGKTLPWWAIGSSLVAANISAEQFIGMSGSGFAIGLGIASYEWVSAFVLLVVAKYFLPLFLEKKIFTMPQFLQVRFDSRVKTSLAVFWIAVYVFVNLTSVMYLGALAIKTIMGIDLIYGILGLAFIAATYSISGGLKAVVWTDVIQLVFLIFGGLMTTYLAIDAVGNRQGIWIGVKNMLTQAPEKFDMILSKDNPYYQHLPGISVLVGGMWVAALSYFGCNQYIIQKALAAKNIDEAQKGLAFAGYLKLLTPLIVVIPGIAAFVLKADITKPDEAYPWLLHNFVFTGVKGLVFAALIAAIVSSLGAMLNSTSTIFTLDIYQHFFNKKATGKQLIKVGRIASAVALLIAVLVAPALGTLDQAFQFIQEYTGFITPGILAIFMLGLFWKGATSNAALWTAILTIPGSAFLDFFLSEIPFLDRMGIAFIFLASIMIIISLIEKKGRSDSKGIELQKGIFHTSTSFNLAGIGISAILLVIYTIFW